MTTDNLKLAELGIVSGKFWLLKYTNLQVLFTTSLNYLDFHQNFRLLVLEQANNSSERSKLTNDLAIINKEITTSIKFIKIYLHEEYGDNAKSYYSAYGLVFENKKQTFAKDNDKRMLGLDILIKTLQDTNNIIGIQKYGLVYWLDLQNKHRTAWTIAKTLDGTCSMNSANLKQMKAHAILLQKSLRAQIRIDFALNYKAILRDFGFQQEKY